MAAAFATLDGTRTTRDGSLDTGDRHVGESGIGDV